jgi:hypothetical protein
MNCSFANQNACDVFMNEVKFENEIQEMFEINLSHQLDFFFKMIFWNHTIKCLTQRSFIVYVKDNKLS